MYCELYCVLVSLYFKILVDVHQRPLLRSDTPVPQWTLPWWIDVIVADTTYSCNISVQSPIITTTMTTDTAITIIVHWGWLLLKIPSCLVHPSSYRCEMCIYITNIYVLTYSNRYSYCCPFAVVVFIIEKPRDFLWLYYIVHPWDILD